MSATVTALHLVAPSGSRSAVPEKPYQAIVKVDPNVFRDVTLAEAAVLSVFAAWTKSLPMAPRHVSDTIQSIDLQLHHVGRLASRIATRTLRWAEERYVGMRTASTAPIPLESVDPWEWSRVELRRRTSHIIHCGSCSGRGQRSCSSCLGTSQVKCSNCNGAGKAYGLASNGSRRLMNCRNCNKAGRVACRSCVSGLVGCGHCNTSGKFERWIDFSETEQLVVRSEPDGEWTRAFAWGWNGTAVSDSEIELDACILGQVSADGPLSKYTASTIALPDWLESNWQRIQPKLDRSQRVVSQKFVLLEIPRVELTYALPNAKPSVVTFEGRRMLVPPPAADQQFNARARKVRRARRVTFGAAGVIFLLYLLRGGYFWSGPVFALGMSLFAAAFAFEGYLRQVTLRRASARRWVRGAGLAVAAAALFAMVAEPTLRQARRYVSSGQLDRAEEVLIALGDPKSADRAALWAELHLAEVLREKQPKKLAEIVATIPPTRPQYAPAAKHLFTAVREAVEADLAAGRQKEALALLETTNPVLKGVTDGALRADIAELNAKAWDATYAACDDDPCRWMTSRASEAFAPTAERQAHLQQARPRVIAALAARPELPVAGSARLDRLAGLEKNAQAVSAAQPDEELQTRATALIDWVQERRNEIPVVGSEQKVGMQLLKLTDVAGRYLSGTMGKVAVHCNVQRERCIGLYIVTAERGGSALNDRTYRADAARALSRAVGRETELPQPPKAPKGIQTTSWSVGKVPITARWMETDLVELRVGDVGL